jgi:hypothetical protein
MPFDIHALRLDLRFHISARFTLELPPIAMPPVPRYLGNTKTNEFHDRARERPQCQLSEIIAHAHQKFFTPDSWQQAVLEGFEPCFFCVGTVADLSWGGGTALASPADLRGRDLGGGQVALEWSHPDDIMAQDITFDVYSSPDPLNPFRTLRAGGLAAMAVVLSGFTDGGAHYFTVVARRGPLLSLPSATVLVAGQPIVQPVLVGPGAAEAAALPSGLGFPFKIDGTGGVLAQGGDPLLRGKILQLLLTAPGERVNLPDYGTRLRDLVFDPNNDVLAATTEFMVNRALQKYLGDEIHVEKVQVTNQENELDVDIVYLRKSDLRLERVRVGVPVP